MIALTNNVDYVVNVKQLEKINSDYEIKHYSAYRNTETVKCLLPVNYDTHNIYLLCGSNVFLYIRLDISKYHRI